MTDGLPAPRLRARRVNGGAVLELLFTRPDSLTMPLKRWALLLALAMNGRPFRRSVVVDVDANTGLAARLLLAIGTLGTATAMVLFGVAREPVTALAAGVIAGASWIAAIASLNVSAQLALPDWVRGRGLAIFVTAFFGALTVGSAIWGQAASLVGLPTALFLAAAGAIVMLPLTWRWKLQTGAGIDHTPSLHWPTPVLTHDLEQDRGPVLVTVQYRIDPRDRRLFLAAIEKLAPERRRDGAYAWGVFEDAAKEGRMVETFMVESWLEHLRQHERVTNADRVLQEMVNRFQIEGVPMVTHFIGAE